MQAFDDSGDGSLQPAEFRGVEEFKRKLELLIREEKEAANNLLLKARKAKKAAEVAEARSSALAEVINDRPPTIVDRLLSVLPYTFPFLDALTYAEYLLRSVDGVGPGENNPVIAFVIIMYKLYQNIPFSGLIAFFALNYLSRNLQLNRLVRFNIRQAIFIDIALIFPGIITGFIEVVLPSLGFDLPGDFVAGKGAFIFPIFFRYIRFISSLTDLYFSFPVIMKFPEHNLLANTHITQKAHILAIAKIMQA